MPLPIKLKLPPEYLNEEVRCGYTVVSKLKKIWAVELDLLAELQRVCDKYSIKFQVYCGTMLGAVRHRGFIPWDDDVDVALTRKEFDRLCDVGQSEFTHPYFFQTALTDRKRFVSYARLRNSETTAVVDVDATPEYNNGIYIDIFVLEGYSDSRLLFKIQGAVQKVFLNALTYYHCKIPKGALPKRIFNLTVKAVANCLPYEFVYRLYKRVLGAFTRRAKRVGMRDYLGPHNEIYWLYKSECENLVEMPFEILTVPVSRYYDAILHRLYGDYKKFPSEAERGKWHEGQIHFYPDISYLEYFRKEVSL